MGRTQLCWTVLALAACQSNLDDGVPPGGDGGRLADATTEDDGGRPADAGADATDPSQFDEDGDGVNDIADNCPTVANPGQEDVDEIGAGAAADGVGDDCDPGPTRTGDSIAYFDGFNGDTIGSEWTALLGTWSVAGGELAQSSTAPTFSVLSWTGTLPDRARIDTEMTVTTLPPMSGVADTTRVVGVLGRYGTPATGYGCVLFADPTDIPGTTAAVLSELPSTGLDTAALSWDMTAGVPVRLRFTVKDDTSRQMCNLRRVASGPQVTAIADDTTVTSGGLGLTTDSLAASFPYVIVYTLGN